MNKRHLLSAVMGLITIASQDAFADQERWPRWYVGLTGGVTFLQDSDLKGGQTGKVDYDTGGIGAISLGYRPPFTSQPFSNLRIEGELGYHNNKLGSARLDPSPSAAASGHTQGVSYMGNIFYDLSNASRWTPYIGAGAGGAKVNLSKDSGLGNIDDSDTVFAYQFMAGLSYAPTTLPMTEWTLGYRYYVENKPAFATATGKIRLDDVTSHDVEVGGRFRF